MVAVEVEPEEPSGRSVCSFDGNHTSDLLSWLLPSPGYIGRCLDAGDFEELMAFTLEGHLAWCFFPVDNVEAGFVGSA